MIIIMLIVTLNISLKYMHDKYSFIFAIVLTCNVPFVLVEIIRDPEIFSASPTFGPEAGGTQITVTGRYFLIPTDRLYLGFESMRHECLVIFS